MSNDPSQRGALFSRVYLERGKPQADSKRFRARVGSEIASLPFPHANTAGLILRELGVKVEKVGHTRIIYKFESFINTAALRDVLDTITLIYRSIQSANPERDRENFRNFVERVMREENLGYCLDDSGGVRFYVDEEFERSRSSIINGLSGTQFAAAREAFQDAHEALLSSDTLTAVRRSFDAVENVFKLQFQVSRLGASEIKSKLGPQLTAVYTGRVADAAGRLAASFAEWTNAAHQFRHAPGGPDPSPPPAEMAILMVSEAASLLRWLVSISEISSNKLA